MHAHRRRRGRIGSSRFRREARSAARLTHPGLSRLRPGGRRRGLLPHDGVRRRSRCAVGSPRRVSERRGVPVDHRGGARRAAAAHRHGLCTATSSPRTSCRPDGRVGVADLVRARRHGGYRDDDGHGPGDRRVPEPRLVSRGVSDPRTDVYATGILFTRCPGRQPSRARPRSRLPSSTSTRTSCLRRRLVFPRRSTTARALAARTPTTARTTPPRRSSTRRTRAA